MEISKDITSFIPTLCTWGIMYAYRAGLIWDSPNEFE